MMKKLMKILVAYDGSSYAQAAINDLKHAGLPPNGEALIVSITDISRLSLANSSELGVLGRFVSPRILEETISQTQKVASRTIDEAKHIADEGALLVQSNLPGWVTSTQTAIGVPTEEILHIADEWKPDLIVIGSHGRGVVGRFFLGSVSESVSERAACSVRVTKRNLTKDQIFPIKIIIGADNLANAEQIVKAVSRRVWSGETEVRLIKVDDNILSDQIYAVSPEVDSGLEQLGEILTNSGSKVSVEVRSGEFGSVLSEEAENWQADAIFIYADNTLEDLSLSEASKSLVANAKCTVETVRQIGREQ